MVTLKSPNCYDLPNMACKWWLRKQPSWINVLWPFYYGRNQFLPWELDEYRALYADKLLPREYGAMLMKRYAERVGISTRGSV